MKPRAEQRGGSFDLQRHYVSELPTPGPIGGTGLDAIPTRSLSSCLNSGLIDQPPDLIRFHSRLPSPGRISRWRGEAPPSAPSFEGPFHFALFRAGQGIVGPWLAQWKPWAPLGAGHGQAGAEVTSARPGMMRLLSEGEDGRRHGLQLQLQ